MHYIHQFHFYILCICRATIGRFSFGMNIHLLVGFFFFASEIFYILILNEHLDPENRTLLILFLISGYMMYFLMLELSLRIPRRLPQHERRRAHLIGWLQEGLMILVLVPIVCWMLQEPVVTLMPTPT
uniref:Uncharacterized protein n=2 Tax=Manihot esculenta TaxID=3983 RepID=A0A251JL33_MANES